MAAEVRDDWEDEGGAGGPEAVSWKYAQPGTVLEGIAVPPDPIQAPSKGYQVVQAFGKGRDKSIKARKSLLVWPPDGDENRRPMTEQEYAAAINRLPQDDPARKVSMKGVPIKIAWLVTGYKEKEFFSGRAVERANEDAEFFDNGMRRWYIDGPDVPRKTAAALEAIGQRGILPGMRIKVRLDKREQNSDSEGETNRFSIAFEMPTPETLKVVKEYVDSHKAVAAASTPVEDPWAAGSTTDEPPPF